MKLGAEHVIVNRSNVDKPAFYVDEVRFHAAERREQTTGLLGYVSFRLNRGLRIDGITLRRTRRGELCLSFPARRGLTGSQFFFVRPLDERTRKEIESQVFAQLGLAEGVHQ